MVALEPNAGSEVGRRQEDQQCSGGRPKTAMTKLDNGVGICTKATATMIGAPFVSGNDRIKVFTLRVCSSGHTHAS